MEHREQGPAGRLRTGSAGTSPVLPHLAEAGGRITCQWWRAAPRGIDAQLCLSLRLLTGDQSKPRGGESRGLPKPLAQRGTVHA